MTSRIYLASKSPRRREILAGLGYEICLLTPEISPAADPQTDEERRPGESARSYVLRTAREKALDAIRVIEEKRLEELPVVSADTTVVFGETILRKPQSVEEELRFLDLLSG
ncbi:MAG: Maf family protein, partial [Sutterella sp.]|nr:Maf family protein [Sutterella sp.]